MTYVHCPLGGPLGRLVPSLVMRQGPGTSSVPGLRASAQLCVYAPRGCSRGLCACLQRFGGGTPRENREGTLCDSHPRFSAPCISPAMLAPIGDWLAISEPCVL